MISTARSTGTTGLYAFVGAMILSLCSAVSAQAHPIARVASEVATANESDRSGKSLHQWLTAKLAAGTRDRSIAVALTDEERRELASPDNATQGRIRVGMVKPMKHSVQFRAADAAGLSTSRRAAGGMLSATDDGGFVWAAALQSDTASGIRLHLTNLSLAAGATLYIFGGDEEAFGPYTGTGPNGDGELWSNTVMDSEAVIVLHHPAPAGADDLARNSFVIAEVGLLGPSFVSALTPVPESFCSNNAACVENATCYSQTPADAAKNAIALMQWVSGAFLYSCSGGLLADTVSSSQIPYFLSANHCLSRDREARSLECFFQYQVACGVSACPAKTGFPRTLGATVKATNKTGDFTLLQLSQQPPSGSVFLGWNNQPIAFSNGADLYRISHPKASPQALSQHRVDTSAATCSGWPRGERIYSRDVVGATEGGSSGSPVLNGAGEVVGQLSGGCGFNIGDTCDNVANATVDGALASYFNAVAPFLAPGGATENCTDGIDNDGDGAVDCNDADCSGSPACASCSPVGASCSVDNQCCSNKCRGGAGRLTCR